MCYSNCVHNCDRVSDISSARSLLNTEHKIMSTMACVVSWCDNRRGTLQSKSNKISFHGFPNDEKRREAWIKLFRKIFKQPSWEPLRNSVICSIHFDVSDIYFTPKGRGRLKPHALPTKFLTVPSADAPDEVESQQIERVPAVEQPEVQSEFEPVARPVVQQVTQPVPTVKDNKFNDMRERKSSEVDKFKRRIVRTVSRKIREHNDEEELEKMWETMKKETRCDCKLLWERMRTLTLKKLKRLLPADDRNDTITSIARLSATDWLLFDLVLVHENIDVIGQELWEKTGEEPEVLYELFFLVQEYEVEKLSGTALVDAWLSLTREYNEGDRKCSPMMLQRRWYQMKQCARERFYNFWGSYRGNINLLERAKVHKPTNLQVDIVRKYRTIIIKKFSDWEELIAERKVILAQEFDERIAASRKNPVQLQDEQPEVELVEQNVETISLEGDSDSDNEGEKDQENSDTTKFTAKIKKELIDSIDIEETDSLKLLESINIPCETPFGQIEDESLPADANSASETIPTLLNDTLKDNVENETDDDDDMDELTPCDDDDSDFDQNEDEKDHNEYSNKTKSSEGSPTQVTDDITEDDESGIAIVKTKTEIDTSYEGTGNLDSTHMLNSNNLPVHDSTVTNELVNNSVITKEMESAINILDDDEEMEVEATEDMLPKIASVTSVAVPTSTKLEAIDDQILSEKANSLPTSMKPVASYDQILAEKANSLPTSMKPVASYDQILAEKANSLPTSMKPQASYDQILAEKANSLPTSMKPVASYDQILAEKANSLPTSMKPQASYDQILAEKANSLPKTIEPEASYDQILAEKANSLPKCIEPEVSYDQILAEKANSLPKYIEPEASYDKILAEKANSLPKCIDPEVSYDQILAEKANSLLNSIKPEAIIDQSEAEKANSLAFFQHKDFLDNFEVLPSDIQFVDDGIVIDDEDDDNVKDEIKIKIEDAQVTDTNGENESCNVDLKLLLFPTVYTKKLDHMDVFKFLEYDQIRDRRIIDCAIIESKPVDVKAVKTEENPKDKPKEQKIESKEELKQPKEEPEQEQNIQVKEEPKIVPKEEPEEEFDVDNFDNDLATSSDEESIDFQKHRIKLSSWLLQKPRVKNYNPIQLCKNPDFNTRLKRLTSGFLSYERNRRYLKRCQPVTIDLHKTFETKLIYKTLYLKDEYTQAISIPGPIAPIPRTSSSELCAARISNINNVDRPNELPDTSSQTATPMLQTVSSQRNKVVNLPDINEVRRINQNLLCAEVAPIQSKSPPIKLNASPHSSDKDVEMVENDTFIENSTGKTGGQDVEIVNRDITGEVEISNLGVDVVQTPHTIPDADLTSININSNASKTVKLKSMQDKLMNRLSKLSTLCPDSRGKKTTKLVEKPIYKTARLQRLRIPWLSRTNYRCEDALLASDTVDKMLMLFTGEICYRKKKSNSNHKMISSSTGATSSETLKETLDVVSLQTNSTPVAQTSVNKQNVDFDVQKKNKKRGKKPVLMPLKQNSDDVNIVLKYCCWARKKIANKGVNEDFHTCKTHCVCCCSNILGKILKRGVWKTKMDQQLVEPIVLSDDDSDVVKSNVDTNSMEDNTTLNTPEISSLVPESINIDNSIDSQDISNISEHKDRQTLQMANISDLSQQPILVTSLPQPLVTQSQPQSSQLQPNSEVTETRSSETFSVKYSKSTVRGRLRKRPEMPKTVYSYNKLAQEKVQVKLKGNEIPRPSPIFIGVNKILLTSRPYYRPPDLPLEAPQILLPNGVHFVLLPNKELAVSIEPGVELDQNELQELQSIKNNIQKHIDTFSLFNNATTNNLPDCGTDNNNHQEDNENSEINENAMHENEDKVDDLQQSDASNLPNTNQTQSISDLPLDNINYLETNNLLDGKNKDEQNSDKQEKGADEVSLLGNPSTGATMTSRKTILSDLMEMSGISEEDAKIPETPTRNLLMTINPLPMDGTVQTPLPATSVEQELVVTDFIQSPPALAALAARPDLKIVTTYNDLKSSFDINSNFFKLDIMTGEMSSVNVCIKKREPLLKTKHGIPNSDVVVDLTEDTENDGQPSNTEIEDTEKGETVNIETESVAKPVKLFRAIHPSILRNDSKGFSVLKTFKDIRSDRIFKRVDANKILKIVTVNKRKQHLNQPFRLEISDSDEDGKLEKNMPEGHEKTQLKTIDDYSDESDEEPLAKKAKRQSEIAAYSVPSTNNDEANDNEKSQSEENMTLLEMPNHMLMDEELDEQPELEACENDSEEDCILGV
ncbi:uncharacterized protein LOC123702026 isoform X2 [Colias croceus]|uniref:uncharacterized protein LOC123702026 isoform X2 n=1 Tax=Colias crocea TaxID=72248 RepID=UPI001E27B547|nr:uncharacterized protein LOC123702026 isoform X2 [Colias croceus]